MEHDTRSFIWLRHFLFCRHVQHVGADADRTPGKAPKTIATVDLHSAAEQFIRRSESLSVSKHSQAPNRAHSFSAATHPAASGAPEQPLLPKTSSKSSPIAIKTGSSPSLQLARSPMSVGASPLRSPSGGSATSSKSAARQDSGISSL